MLSLEKGMLSVREGRVCFREGRVRDGVSYNNNNIKHVTGGSSG